MARSVDMAFARYIDTWVGLVVCSVLFVFSRIRSRFGGPHQPDLRSTTPPGQHEVPRAQRVLAIKLYGLGNVTMLLPAVAAVRQGLPGVEIDFLTLRENRTLLERAGVVDRTIGVSAEGYGRLIGSLWRAFRAIRRRRYDLVIDFEQFVKLSAIIAYLSGAPERIGFNTDGQRRGWLFTTRVVYTDSEHMLGIFMRLLRPLGIDSHPEAPSLAIEPEEAARAGAILAEHGVAPDHFPLVGVHVGSGPNFYEVPLKRWPTRSFAGLCDALIERHGASIVFTGKGSEERALIRETTALMHHPAIDSCDQLSVGELLALLRACHLVVSNDTSVMHLAAALKTPVVALFGPTNPLQYGPGNDEDLVLYKDLFCSPCLTNYNLKVSYCSDPVCIRTISVEEVLAEIEGHFLGTDAPMRPRLETAGDGAPRSAESD
jgi:lipopolysaccharide heptosyltransferase II